MSHLRDRRDVEYIRETSDRALEFMSIYNVVPSPSNYQVWYDYSCEENMSLNTAIDEMIQKKQSFTSKVSNNLYEKFYFNDQEHNAISSAGQGIQTELTRIVKAVSEIHNGTEKYGASLNESLHGLDNVPGGEELKSIISGLYTETQEFAKKSNSAQNQLKQSAKTVQKLQTALEAVRQESMTDMLTNIGNRKSFEENLETAIKNAHEKKHDLCLVIGDIDHFKIFNDTWGHHVGDQVLKAVAHTMRTRVGESGTAARYGGEEFVILLPESSMKMTQKITDTIRLSIAGRRMKRKSTGENIGKITCSFGVAKYRQGEHRNEFLERADAALYQSKANGRNKITTEDDQQPNLVKIA